MNGIITDEIRDFIEAARADTGQANLEEAWVSAFRSFLSQESRNKLSQIQHRIKLRETLNDSRAGEPWEEWELDLAFNPNYTYTQVARYLGRTPWSVTRAREVHRKKRRARLQELTDIIYGKYD